MKLLGQQAALLQKPVLFIRKVGLSNEELRMPEEECTTESPVNKGIENRKISKLRSLVNRRCFHILIRHVLPDPCWPSSIGLHLSVKRVQPSGIRWSLGLQSSESAVGYILLCERN